MIWLKKTVITKSILIFRIFIVILVCLILFSTLVSAEQTLTVAWDESPEEEVVGYYFYYGIERGSYNTPIQIIGKSNTTYTFSDTSLNIDFTQRKYYFAVKAYADDGSRSPFSNIIVWRDPIVAGEEGWTLGTDTDKDYEDINQIEAVNCIRPNDKITIYNDLTGTQTFSSSGSIGNNIIIDGNRHYIDLNITGSYVTARRIRR